jgi:two-component system, sensor histidine kinase and response regulator
MSDRNKNRTQLLHELADLHKRLVDVEVKEAAHDRVEQELRESEQWFRILTESSSEGITITVDGIIIELNGQLAKMHGYIREEMLGKDLIDIFPPESHPSLTAALKQDVSGPYEVTGIRKDGTKFPVEVRGKITQYGGRGVRVSTIRDLSTQKQAEARIKQERNLLRTLIDNLPDAIYVKDKECQKTIANPADLRNMNVHEESDVIGKTDFDFFSSEAASAFYADDKSVIQSGESVLNREESFINKDGRKHWLLTSKLPLKNEKGETIGIIGIGRNITEQKQTQEALRNERNLLRTLIDSMPEFINYKDADGRYLLNNRAHLRALGVERQEDVIGKTMYDFHPPELIKLYEEEEKQLIQTGEPILDKEESVLHHDTNNVHWHLTSKVPLKDEHGKVTSYITISTDITERKKAEIERERLIKELQQALTDIKTLSGLVPICAKCKKIRDDTGYWTQVESYIQEHSQARFSHGLCPDCMKNVYSDFVPKKKE